MVTRIPTANSDAIPNARPVLTRPCPLIKPTMRGMLDRWHGLSTTLSTPHTAAAASAAPGAPSTPCDNAINSRSIQPPYSVLAFAPPAFGLPRTTPRSFHFARISSFEKNPSWRNSSLPAASKRSASESGLSCKPSPHPGLSTRRQSRPAFAPRTPSSAPPGLGPSSCTECTCPPPGPPVAATWPRPAHSSRWLHPLRRERVMEPPAGSTAPPACPAPAPHGKPAASNTAAPINRLSWDGIFINRNSGPTSFGNIRRQLRPIHLAHLRFHLRQRLDRDQVHHLTGRQP